MLQVHFGEMPDAICDRRFSIRVLNSGRVVHDMLGLIDEAGDAS